MEMQPRTLPDMANDALQLQMYETAVPRTGTVAADAVFKGAFTAVGLQVEPVGGWSPFSLHLVVA